MRKKRESHILQLLKHPVSTCTSEGAQVNSIAVSFAIGKVAYSRIFECANLAAAAAWISESCVWPQFACFATFARAFGHQELVVVFSKLVG